MKDRVRTTRRDMASVPHDRNVQGRTNIATLRRGGMAVTGYERRPLRDVVRVIYVRGMRGGRQVAP